MDKRRKELSYDASRWQFDLTDPQNTKDKYILTNEVLSEPDEDGVQILKGLIIKEHSSIATRIEAVLTNNSFYYLQAAVEKANPSGSEYINQCFNSFKVVPEKVGSSVFEDKVDLYILDIRSEEDSIHYSAIQSTTLLEINEDNLEKIKGLLDVYEFQQDELNAQFELIRQLIQLDENAGISYLEKIYKSQNVLPSTQLEVLQLLTLVDNKKAYEKIQEFMEFDLPLSESIYEISLLFNLMKQTKNSDLLFPDILQYYVVPEYNSALVEFVEYAVNSDKVSSRKLKSYRKLLLTNAKLEYKRLKSWKYEQELVKLEMYDMPYYYNGRSKAPIDNLLSYIHILSVFKKDKDVSELVLKIEELDIDEYYLDQLDRRITKSQHVDDELLQRLSRSSETKFSVIQAMHQLNKHSSLNLISEDSIAYYAISQFNRLKPDTDSLTFIEKQTEEFEGRNIRYFFYKVTDINETVEINKSEKIVGIAFILEEDKVNPQSFRSFKMKQFIDEKDLKDYISISLDEWKYLSNKRVSHGKFKSTSSFDYYGNDFFEDDYYEDDYYEEGY